MEFKVCLSALFWQWDTVVNLKCFLKYNCSVYKAGYYLHCFFAMAELHSKSHGTKDKVWEKNSCIEGYKLLKRTEMKREKESSRLRAWLYEVGWLGAGSFKGKSIFKHNPAVAEVQ